MTSAGAFEVDEPHLCTCYRTYTKLTLRLHVARICRVIPMTGSPKEELLPMFQLKNVTRQFGKKTAVSSVTFDIPQGQMVGIIGRSGAGKSTLLRMINRLVGPSSGSIEFAGYRSPRSGARPCASGSATAP